jgi:hypothetical protein
MSSLRAVGRPLRRSSATVDRAMTQRETQRVMQRDPIVIFSMGKTGTTSLAAALEHAARRPVVKAHALSDAGIDARLAKADRLAIVARPRFLWSCQEIARSLHTGGTWDILCGVREPVALAVSDHFYGLQLQQEQGHRPWIADDNPAAHVEAIEQNLRDNFINTDWFNSELRTVTTIDVYDTPFDSSVGHAHYEADRFRALLVRAEDLPRVGGPAVADFLGLNESPAIGHRNSGTSNDPDSPYRRFVERGALSPELVDEVYATKMAQHFYTDEERATFRRRWTGVLV